MQNPHWTDPLKRARKSLIVAHRSWLYESLSKSKFSAFTLVAWTQPSWEQLQYWTQQKLQIRAFFSQRASLPAPTTEPLGTHPWNLRMPDSNVWEPFTDFKCPDGATQPTFKVCQSPTAQGRFLSTLSHQEQILQIPSWDLVSTGRGYRTEDPDLLKDECRETHLGGK